MGFLQNITLPNNVKITPKKSGFLGNVIMPSKNYVEPAKTTEGGGMEFKTLPNAKLVPDNFIEVGQEIKTPFIQSGVVVPSGDGIGAGYSAFKSLVEFPEKATRTLTTDFGKSRQTELKQWRVPSYSETASKNVGQLIDEGVPPTAAVILGGSQVAGEFANDALIFDSIFGNAVRNIATRALTPESQTLAYDFLGRPRTLAEAEKSFKTIQKEFHPDITGGDATMSTQANNAIQILRKNGIPNQNILQKGFNTLMNKPLSSFFKTSSETPKVSGFLNNVVLPKEPIKPSVETPVKAPTTPKTISETTIAPKPIESIEVKPKIVKVSSEQLPVGTGETQVSRLEARMKEKLDSVSPEKAKEQGLSTFEQMNKKEQIKMASDYVSKNPEEALQVLKGEVPAPKDLLHNSIALALESQVEITGNAELVSKLASLRSTRFGQEISILTETDPLNVVSQTKGIQIARENAIIKKTGKTISKAKADVSKEIDKIIKEEKTLAQIKVEEAEKLLDSLVC